MRQILLIFSLFCASYMTVNAQTNTWTGAGANTNWNTVANWSLNAVPTAANDVVIPTGFTVDINVVATTKSIVVQGNATLNISNNLSYLNASSFEANTTINWNTSTITGNGSVLNNMGSINVSSNNVTLASSTILTNNGTIKLTSSGDIYISTNGVINNTASGIIDFQGDNSGFYGSGAAPRIINNQGLIRTSFSDATHKSSIGVEMVNNGGTIQVNNGTLNFTSAGIELEGGVYNVVSGATLDWAATVSLSGTLTGNVQGDLIWRSLVNVLNSATFNFSGNKTVKWVNGRLTGGGTLNNQSEIEIQNNNVTIENVTTLTNNGQIILVGTGDIYISTNATLNNNTNGIIDFKGDGSGFSASGGMPRILNNKGLIKTSFNDIGAKAIIAVELRNDNGTIQVESGTLDLTSSGTTLTDGTYNVYSGATLEWSSTVALAGTISGLINGNFNWKSQVLVDQPAAFNFTGNETVNWLSGTLAGSSALTNNSIIKVQNNNVNMAVGVTLNNYGQINLVGSGDVYIATGASLNNTATGIIDFSGNAAGFSGSGAAPRILNNQGTIKTSFADSTDKAVIGIELRNNGGVIQVENGTLDFTSSGIELNGGVYNVFSNGVLDWSSTVTLSGTLTGVVDGTINWKNTVAIIPSGTATYNFSGNKTVNWTSGYLSGGELINQSIIAIQTNNVTVNSGAVLTNTGEVNLMGSGDIYIATNSVVNNMTSGVIQFIGDGSGFSGSGGSPRILNNEGLLKTAFTNDIVSDKSNIGIEVTNKGIIDANTGTLSFSSTLDNQLDAIIKGIATINLPSAANFTNNGIFAPGGSPGVLTVVGNYKSSATSVLDVELNGLVQGTEYDLLAITGTNVVFDGDVNVTMGFDAAVGNSFTIATVSGTIATKSLTTPLTANYNGFRYTFNVTYPNDKAVRLTISSRVDIQPPTVVTQDVTLQLNASGTATLTASQVNNGSSDNGTSNANLVYTLSKTSFNCSNLGSNTVTLTVTDEAGNSASAPATITVEDVTAPIVTCPADQTVDVNAVEYTLPDYFGTGDLTVSDNCSFTVVQSPVAGTKLTHGIHNITFAVTDAAGNVATCNFDLTVNDLSLGIDDYELSDSDVLLFPNPVHHILTIKNVGHLELLSADIVDITGKTMNIINLQQMGLSKEISLENFASGMYFVKIKGKTGVLTKRIVKE